MPSPFSLYIQALRTNHNLGVAETSSYGALQNLLDSVGAKLKPSPVRCILHPKSVGAGIPDGGLFTREQLKPLGRDFDAPSALKLLPKRGVLEIKSTKDDLKKLLQDDKIRAQLDKYLGEYRKVIFTNYYQFIVFDASRDNALDNAVEEFGLAHNGAEFWAATGNITALEADQGESLMAFLERALLYGAALAAPEAIAGFMASCAREAKVRVERADVEDLKRVRGALETALNVSFHGNKKAEDFFRSSLVQTLFYGVFSAWILWCRKNPHPTKKQFDWAASAQLLAVPVIAALFHEFSNPQTLKPLGLDETLDWVTAMLNEVDRPAFEKSFGDDGAVQYFYEPFLQAFDPELRRELGVWYTPTSVVRYMVARVDETLKTELGIANGLADPSVVVLDPCCGTGAFLVEVIRHLAATLQRDNPAMAAAELRDAVIGTAATPGRLFGFELLTAPFVVAHLQLGLELGKADIELKAHERAPVFLTNALTGWQGQGPQNVELPGLQQETEAANRVKNQEKILVILGNPPYSGYAGIAIEQERELSEAYRQAVGDVAAPEGQGLNDLYVRFFRMAERKITEETGRGIVCYISNYSWLEGKSHTAMREAYLHRFSKIWIDNLHGDRKISEYNPDGQTSESLFTVRGSSAGIRIGTSIALLARSGPKNPATKATLLYRDFHQARADDRRQALLDSLKPSQTAPIYQELKSEAKLGLPFKPAVFNADYGSWKKLPELFPVSFPGVTTSRDEVVIDIDRERLEARMQAYFDPNVSDADISHVAPQAMKETQRFDAKKTRKTLLARGFLPANIVRYCYRPFDARWLYWEPETKLLDEKRVDCWPHIFSGNTFLFTTGRTRRAIVEPSLSTPFLSDYNLMDSGARGIPLYLRDLTVHSAANPSLFEVEGHVVTRPNLSDDARDYLAELQLADGASSLFWHALAVQHAPRYRAENADALRLDWPRIPLPLVPDAADFTDEPDDDEIGFAGALEVRRMALQLSARLGESVALLLDVTRPIEGVTTNVRADLKALGAIAKTGGGALQIEAGHFGLTAGWGYRSNGSVSANTGRFIERPWTPDERAAIEAGASGLHLDFATAIEHLGANCFDVYLNDVAFWRAVPANVWHYTMGGYPVLKKWLSYREAAVLGRDLRKEEIGEFTAIVRRISALLLLEPQLDANYAAVCALSGASEAGEEQAGLWE